MSNESEVPSDGEEYRIWSVTNQKCLVLKKSCSNNAVPSVTCDGRGDETGTGDKGSCKSQLFIFVVLACFLIAYFTKEIQPVFAAIL